MDVQTWLHDIVLPELPPSLPAEHCGIQLVQPNEPEQVVRVKRKRRQSTSDSSLLKGPSQRRKTTRIAREVLGKETANESAGSVASHPTGRSGCSTSSQPYARRPRRKTRPERYEPPLKGTTKRGTHTNRHRKGESNKAKRQTTRQKVDQRGAGIVQGFHARNVPRDRLTLKPRGKLGLFSNGRASSPVKGRGLPDLVFSEMRFLQGQRDGSETGLKPEGTKKTRKAVHPHAKEDEISAYFTSVRPALAENDVNSQAKEGSRRKELRKIGSLEQERSLVVDNAIPTVELADKTSFLGFGSRGPRHKSNSYISWSESVQAPTVPHARLCKESTVDSSQICFACGGQTAEQADGMEEAPLSMTRHFTDRSGGLFQVSSLDPANNRVSRSHSLPQHTFSTRRMNLIDRVAKRRAFGRVTSPSSIPHGSPVATKTRDHSCSGVSGATTLSGILAHGRTQGDLPIGIDTHSEEARQRLRDEIDQRPSSSLRRILLDCNTTFDERRQAAATHRLSNAGSKKPMPPTHKESMMRQRQSPIVETMPTVRYSCVDKTQRARVPQLSRPNMYEQQEQRQLPDQACGFGDSNQPRGSYLLQGEQFDYEEMGDEEHDWDEEQELNNYVAGPGISSEELLAPLEDEDVQEGVKLKKHVVVNSGFWRPHKLY